MKFGAVWLCYVAHLCSCRLADNNSVQKARRCSVRASVNRYWVSVLCFHLARTAAAAAWCFWLSCVCLTVYTSAFTHWRKCLSGTPELCAKRHPVSIPVIRPLLSQRPAIIMSFLFFRVYGLGSDQIGEPYFEVMGKCGKAVFQATCQIGLKMY